MASFKSTFLALITTFAGLGFAQSPSVNVDVKDAWVRSTVPGQMGTGAFMKITAKEGTKLVGVSSPVAGVGEVHEMKMEGDVMKMRAMPVLDLPAGKTVELKPGGYHVMLMDLKQPLLKDSKVPLTLRFKDAKGVESKLELSVPVSAVAPGVTGASATSATGGHAGAAHKH
jgi:copper(I)-binding protein